MFVRGGLLCVLLVLAACEGRGGTAAAPVSTRAPNILLILVDDLGVNDLGAYGGRADLTPSLDRIAREGVRFERHYTDSTCTASRVALLTGQPPARLGFRPSGAGIPAEVETLPEQLREAGYTTHHIGKWHLGFVSRQAWPLSQGFDSFFGFLSQFLLRGPHEPEHWKTGRPRYLQPWLQEDDGPLRQYSGHLSALLNERVLRFIDERADDTRPWFLNYWTYAPHAPLQPLAQYMEAGEGDGPGARYKAMLRQLDDHVARVISRLEERGLASNTLVIVASDNGGTARHYPSNRPWSGAKASFFEGGVRSPLLLYWPGQLAAGRRVSEAVSLLDYLPSLVALAKGERPGTQYRDLLALARGAAAQEQSAAQRSPLFWEASNSRLHSWSVLDASHRWRLVRDFEGALHLAEITPSQEQSISLDQAAQRVETLGKAYRDWRLQQREPSLSWSPATGQGHGTLTGWDLVRTPGVEGWTFGLGLIPGAPPGAQPQTVAAQAGHWSMRLLDGRLRLRVQDLELEADLPSAGRCTEVLVGSYVSQAYSAPAFALGILELFYDGQLVARAQNGRPQTPGEGWEAPTTIGFDAAGLEPFEGRLLRPRLWNERLLADEQADAVMGNGVGAVGGWACNRTARGLPGSAGDKS